MSNTLNNSVLLVGASGDIGKNVLSALLTSSSMKITVLSRLESTTTFPPNVQTTRVDYSNQGELVKALKGQDIVISTVGGEGLIENIDKNLIKAALEADVKWFIPSEYLFDLEHPSASSIPVNLPLLENMELLRKHQTEMAHTFISTGAFLDWGFDNGVLGFDVGNRTATLYDQGENRISGTQLKTFGQSIVTILQHPELTMNRRIYIADASFSQQEALRLFEKETNTQWTVYHNNTVDISKKAEEDWENDKKLDAYYGFLLVLAYNGQGACEFEEKVNNEMLGLERVSLEQIIKETIERKTTNVLSSYKH